VNGLVLVLAGLIIGVLVKALGDLVTEELRGWIDLAPRGILRFAAARLERSQRETVYKDEWIPALASSVRGTETRPLTRLVKGMVFAIGRLIFVWRSPGDVASTSLTPRVSGAPASQPLPARYLQPGETQVVAFHKHPASLVAPIWLVLVGLAIAGWLSSSVAHSNNTALGIIWILWGLLLAGVGWKLFEWSISYEVITTQRVLVVRGVLRRRFVMIPLEKVTNIQIRRSALGRFLGYGEVIIESEGQRRIAQNFIPYPEQVSAELSDLIPPNKEGSSDN
jgi:membrane protein YdbS with pleckstrin-like domain